MWYLRKFNWALLFLCVVGARGQEYLESMFPIDPNMISIGGYSMGGIGTASPLDSTYVADTSLQFAVPNMSVVPMERLAEAIQDIHRWTKPSQGSPEAGFAGEAEWQKHLRRYDYNWIWEERTGWNLAVNGKPVHWLNEITYLYWIPGLDKWCEYDIKERQTYKRTCRGSTPADINWANLFLGGALSVIVAFMIAIIVAARCQD